MTGVQTCALPISGHSEIPRDQYSSDNGYPALAFTEFGQPYIGWYDVDSTPPFPLNDVHNAVGGNKMLVAGGAAVDPGQWDPIGGALVLNPRTSVGLSSDGNTLIIIVIDGRKTGFSEGVTLPEMSEYLIEFGAHTGLNLDGGGSSTMVFGTSTVPEIINYPSDGTERSRPNHLGIYASSSSSSPLALSQFQLRLDVQTPALYQNYPNPFNPETWIPFTLSADAHVAIRIYGVGGQLIRALDLGYKPTGIYISREKAVYWDGRNEMGESVASGIYFYNIQAGEYTATRKMTVAQ